MSEFFHWDFKDKCLRVCVIVLWPDNRNRNRHFAINVSPTWLAGRGRQGARRNAFAALWAVAAGADDSCGRGAQGPGRRGRQGGARGGRDARAETDERLRNYANCAVLYSMNAFSAAARRNYRRCGQTTRRAPKLCREPVLRLVVRQKAAERGLVAMRTALAASAKAPAPSPAPALTADPLAAAFLPLGSQLLAPVTAALKLTKAGSQAHRTISVAITLLHRLMGFGALPGSLVGEALREVEDSLAMGPPVDVQLKALQVAGAAISCFPPPAVEPEPLSDMPSDEPVVVRSALRIASALHLPPPGSALASHHGGSIISNTAAATMRQILAATFERALNCLQNMDPSTRESATNYAALPPALQTAYAFFHDLCLLTGDPSNPALLLLSPAHVSLSKQYGFELLDSCLVPATCPVFVNLPIFLTLLKTHLLPLLIRTFSDGASEFDLLIRLLRTVESVAKSFAGQKECSVEMEIILSILERLAAEAAGLSGSTSSSASSLLPPVQAQSQPPWIHAPALEFWLRVLGSDAIGDIFTLDMGPETLPSVLNAAGRLATLHPDGYAVIKLACMDQLDKVEPPAVPDGYLGYLGFLVLIGTAAELARLAVMDWRDDPALPRELLAAASPSLLSPLSHLLIAPLDDQSFSRLLDSFSGFCGALARQRLADERGTWLAALGRAALPPLDAGLLAASAASSASAPAPPGSLVGSVVGTLSSLSSPAPAPTAPAKPFQSLSERNLACLRTLIVTASTMSAPGDMDPVGWVPLLSVLHSADHLLYTGKLGGRLQVDGVASIGRKPQGPAAEAANARTAQSVDTALATVRTALSELFGGTNTWDRLAVASLIGGLGRLVEEGKSAGWEAVEWAVLRIKEISVANLPRITSDRALWDAAVGIMVGVAWAPACPAPVRTQTCAAFGEILLAAVQTGNLSDAEVEAGILDALKGFMGLGAGLQRDRSSSFYADVVRSGLDTLNKLLQRSGQLFIKGWPRIFDVVRSVVDNVNTASAGIVSPTAVHKRWNGANFEADDRYLAVAGTEEAAQSAMMTGAANSAMSRQAGIIRAAFPAVQLICTDFLPLLDADCLSSCVEAVACFGAQNEDLNVTLSAVGLTWTVSDHIMTLRTAAKEGSGEVEDIAPAAADMDVDGLNVLWRNLLEQLADLCTDPRPEVRHAANQTLFRIITLHGAHLGEDVWDDVLWNVLFPLLEKVRIVGDKVAQATERAAIERERAKATSSEQLRIASSGFVLHHSRNTVTRQWDETRALTLAGVGNCFREHLETLVGMQPGKFERAWALFFEYVKDWALGFSQEVSLGAMRTLKTVMSFPQEEPEIAANMVGKLSPLWTTAWREWATIGEGVVIRASSGVETPTRLSVDGNEPENPLESPPMKDFEHVFIPDEDGLPREVSGDFTQETIGTFVSVFLDIFPTIRESFAEDDFRRLIRILDKLLVYTTAGEPGGKYSKAVWDLDALSPLQDALLQILLDLERSKPSISGIVLRELANYVRLPIRRGHASPLRKQAGKAISGKLVQGPTFVTLCIRAMDISWDIYQRQKDSPALYDSEVVVDLIKAHSDILAHKYDCPSPGSKATDAPLWRSASTSFLRLINLALPTVRSLDGRVSADAAAGIFQAVLETIGAFLLSPTSPAPEATEVQLAADEEFDLSMLRSIESDVVPQLGQPDVPEALVLQLVDMLREGSNLYLGAEGTGISSPTHQLDVNGGQTANVAPRIVPVHRERFANECLDLLFRLCSDQKQGRLLKLDDVFNFLTRIPEFPR